MALLEGEAMSTIQIIPAVTGAAVKEGGESPATRVAAYCRVSSLPQEDSYESQVNHFRELIRTHEGWELVEVYGDEGISGLNIKRRRGFQKLLKDAKAKKFDLLLVKSISRWGRNTIDSIEGLRVLKNNGIAVYFEKEGIRTDDSSGEMLLTMLSAFAQGESESISAQTTLGVRYKQQRA